MAPKCLPAEPEFEHPTERAVWDALVDQLPNDAALLANLTFTSRKGNCEADLVVALPGAGIAVLEVKGGRVTYDGQTWRQSGGTAQGNAINPARQALRAMYALRDHLNEDPRWHERRMRYAHLVVLPTSTIGDDVNLTDCPRWMVVDQTQLSGLAKTIHDVLRLQQSQQPFARLQDVDDFLEILTGRPMSQRMTVNLAATRAAVCELLTRRQTKVLDLIRAMTRVEVRGGAGSGKTWLAVEQARRLARDGMRVGLICYSRGLSAYLRRRVELLRADERPAYVGEFHALGLAWGAQPGCDDDSEYWEQRLPAEMTRLAHDLPEPERFDAFVVDEAQDFAAAWWPTLIHGLKDRDHGRMFVFTDEGQRVFARQGGPSIAMSPITLDENLRNTQPIAQTFSSLTPEQMDLRGGHGEPVQYIACSSADAVHKADDAVETLLENGWQHEHVALLTTGSRHPVQIERQAHGQDAYWQSYWAGDDVFYGHVLGFKGLERPAVVLAIDGFGHGDERAREKLYVGLSRARDLLVVCGDLEVIRLAGGEAVVRRLTLTPSRHRSDDGITSAHHDIDHDAE